VKNLILKLVQTGKYSDSENIQFSAESDELPNGITLSANGIIEGTLTEPFENILGFAKSSTIIAKYPGAEDF
jgi:hypothetical protein